MVSAVMPSSIPAGHVLIRIAFAGVNASDVNFSAGRYQASVAEAQAALPFDAGFEAVGAVAALGPQVSGGSLANLQHPSCYLIQTLLQVVISRHAGLLAVLASKHGVVEAACWCHSVQWCALCLTTTLAPQSELFGHITHDRFDIALLQTSL